jgi:nucleotide-binding universal stress UspA family protein
MKRILVPTDFSPNADKALNFAIQLAKQAKGEIFLVHSIEFGMFEEDKENILEKMALISKSVYDNESVTITSTIYSGSPVNAILDVINKLDTDLVVMGTMGNAAFKEKIFGSKTADLIGKCPVPVLVIPLLSDWKIPSKILLAINNFDENQAKLQAAVKLAELFSASIQVAIFTDADSDFAEEYSEHENKIAAFRDLLKTKYEAIEIHAVHLAGHYFIESIEKWVAENNIDILIMLTHKRNILQSIFNRSMTKKMSYHTNIPLLAIPV